MAGRVLGGRLLKPVSSQEKMIQSDLQRQNSSFAEYFEGDFGQRLLSRRQWKEERVASSWTKEDTFGNDDLGLFMTPGK